MKSHEYAAAVKETAERLSVLPNIEIGSHEPYLFMHFWEKEVFLGAVRAFGAFRPAAHWH